MGTINYGNQIESIDYYAPADSDVLNRRNITIIPRGIYNGGLLSKVNDTTVTLSTLVSEIGDDTNQVRIETQSNVTVTVALSPATRLDGTTADIPVLISLTSNFALE